MNQSPYVALSYAYLLVHDIARSSEYWQHYFDHQIFQQAYLSDEEALRLGSAELANQAVIWLQSQGGNAWLCLVEAPTLKGGQFLEQSGWTALEINVKDVKRIHQRLHNSPFTILGKPASLDVNPNIKAMQIIGPDGEVIYLTQIDQAQPPFELPSAQCQIDQFFIAVAAVKDKTASINFYKHLSQAQELEFTTAIRIINNTLALGPTHQTDICLFQLSNNTLIEIDQIPSLKSPSLQTGIGLIGLESNLPIAGDTHRVEHGPYKNKSAQLIRGVDGEIIEIIHKGA